VQELFDHPSNSFVDEIRVCSSVYVRLVEMSFSSFIPFIETLVDEKRGLLWNTILLKRKPYHLLHSIYKKCARKTRKTCPAENFFLALGWVSLYNGMHESRSKRVDKLLIR